MEAVMAQETAMAETAWRIFVGTLWILIAVALLSFGATGDASSVFVALKRITFNYRALATVGGVLSILFATHLFISRDN